jgi:hypothetical protein
MQYMQRSRQQQQAASVYYEYNTYVRSALLLLRRSLGKNLVPHPPSQGRTQKIRQIELASTHLFAANAKGLCAALWPFHVWHAEKAVQISYVHMRLTVVQMYCLAGINEICSSFSSFFIHVQPCLPAAACGGP